MRAGKIYVIIQGIDLEAGHDTKPDVNQMKYGLWDPDNRFYGSIKWHHGYPTGRDYFPIEGGKNIKCSKI